MIWNWRYSGTFFDYDQEVKPNPFDRAYNSFIETFLYFTRLYEYGGGWTIDSVLDLPYCLYNDIIIKQIKQRKAEIKEVEKLKERQRLSSSRNRKR